MAQFLPFVVAVRVLMPEAAGAVGQHELHPQVAPDGLGLGLPQPVLQDFGGRVDRAVANPLPHLGDADGGDDADDGNGDHQLEQCGAPPGPRGLSRPQHEVAPLDSSQQLWDAVTEGVLEVFSPDWLIV
jgi:hypothetical protein